MNCFERCDALGKSLRGVPHASCLICVFFSKISGAPLVQGNIHVGVVNGMFFWSFVCICCCGGGST